MIKDIQGYEGFYQVSDKGEFWSLMFNGKPRRKIRKLKPSTAGNGYLRIELAKNGISESFAAHRLVAVAFIDNPNRKNEINHKNGDKKDNRVENLEWSTRSENMRHMIHVLKKRSFDGADNPRSKAVICTMPDGKRVEYKCMSEAGIKLGIKKATIWQAIKNGYRMRNGTRWEYKLGEQLT